MEDAKPFTKRSRSLNSGTPQFTPHRKRNKAKQNRAPPVFCDATASIVASGFAASRWDEIQSVYKHIHPSVQNIKETSPALDAKVYASRACKTSSRHLRRRATSHKPKRRHRFPEREQQRHLELSTENQRSKSRKALRSSSSWLNAQHYDWHDPDLLRQNYETTAREKRDEDDRSTSTSPACSWIPTHLWHAKRFHMAKISNWQVPMLHANRGAQAALRLSSKEGKCLIQDVTWCHQPLCIKVPPSSADRGAVLRQLGRVIPSFSVVRSIDSPCSGKCLWYKVDQAPLKVIGPVQWVIMERPLLAHPKIESDPDSCTLSSYIYLYVHPDNMSECWNCLEQLQMPDQRMEFEMGIPGGLAYFSMRGKDTMESLEKALHHLSPRSKATTEHALAELLHNDIAYIDLSSEFDQFVTVLRSFPRDQQIPCNRGVCGLDLLCSPKLSHILWIALVIQGRACPVGLVEEAHLALECHPVLPMFPRDYPDTFVGQAYWNAVGDWKVVRQYWEGGLGRIALTSSPSVTTIDSWKNLLIQNNPSEEIGGGNFAEGVVMIRGEFVQPIIDLMCYTSSSGDSGSNQEVARPEARCRRPAKNPTHLIHCPAGLRDQIARFDAQCQSLLQSLALPAVLLAYLRVDGAGGAPIPGSRLYPANCSSTCGVLGIVTCGVFSQQRGRCHGIAVLVVSKFLEALGNSKHTQSLILARDLASEQRSARLMVVLCEGGHQRKASLTLISS